MARSDRSRIEVYPVVGGFKLERFDKYGRKAACSGKTFTRRNNARREAIRLRREKKLGNIPIISIGLTLRKVQHEQAAAAQSEA